MDALRERLILRAGLSIEPMRFGAVRAWLDVCDGRRVAGWAQDAEHPDAPVCLDILVDDVVVAMALTQDHRADLAAAGNGRRAVRLRHRPRRATEARHRSHRRGASLGRWAAGVREGGGRGGDMDGAARGLIRASPGPMALQGGIDTLTHRRIVGWAWESDRPDVPVALVVAIGSRGLGRVTADLYREDLEIAGYATGRCGFALVLPANLLKPRQGYEIVVRVEGSGTHLPGSPFTLGSAMQVVREA